MSNGGRTLLLVLLLLLTGSVSRADGPAPTPLGRRVLALYAASESPSVDRTVIHQAAETPLNHLGLIVDYHDVESGLPTDEQMRAYRGFLTWFQDARMKHAADYCRWFARQIQAGKKAVVLGGLGAWEEADGSATKPELVADALAALGLRDGGNWTDNPFVLAVQSKDAAMVEFERTLQHEVKTYRQIVSTDRKNKVYLTLTRTDRKNAASHAVVVTPTGGFALDGYVLYQDPKTFVRQWRIDPFAFFEAAFGLAGEPRMDVTTLNGARLMYSHIDGDGFLNVSEIDTKKLSPELIDEQILARYDLPFTVSVITGEVHPKALGSARTVSIARKILARSNVEAASHTFSHPYDWTQRKPGLTRIPGYADTYKLEKEIAGSVGYINEHLLPAGKKAAVYQWSGHCNPTPEAIAVVDGLGLLNINGGDSRFDADFPSVAHVAPLTRPGKPVQFYATNTNENLYTGEWTGPFFGFKNVIFTFKNTGSPRRLRPINVYYHFYSGEKQAALTALHEVYGWVLAQNIAPVYTSDYLKTAAGFLRSRIAKLPGGAWEVRDNGACRTARFDDTTAHLDLEKSTGVVGYSHQKGSLYVHLDAAQRHTIALAEAAPTLPYVAGANGFVHSLVRKGDVLTLQASTYRPSQIQLANLKKNRTYTIEVRNGDKITKSAISSSSAGTLTIPLPAGPAVGITIRSIKEKEVKR